MILVQQLILLLTLLISSITGTSAAAASVSLRVKISRTRLKHLKAFIQPSEHSLSVQHHLFHSFQKKCGRTLNLIQIKNLYTLWISLYTTKNFVIQNLNSKWLQFRKQFQWDAVFVISSISRTDSLLQLQNL